MWAGGNGTGGGGTRHYGGRAVERPEADRPRESVEIVANDRRRPLPESGKDIFQLCRCVIVTHGMYSLGFWSIHLCRARRRPGVQIGRAPCRERGCQYV